MTPVSLTAELHVSLMTGFLSPLTQMDTRSRGGGQVLISLQLPQRGQAFASHVLSYVTMLFLHIRHRYSLFDT